MDFLHYGVRRHAAACTTVVAKKPVVKEATTLKEVQKEETKNKEVEISQVIINETIAPVM